MRVLGPMLVVMVFVNRERSAGGPGLFTSLSASRVVLPRWPRPVVSQRRQEQSHYFTVFLERSSSWRRQKQSRFSSE